MSDITVKILTIIVLVVLSALFSSSETAFFSLTRAEIQKLKRSKKSYAKKVIRLLQQPRKILITILLGNELVNVALAVTVASTIYDLAGNTPWKVSILISVCIATPTILIFGEILPKNIAIKHAKGLVGLLIRPIHLFSKIVTPITFMLTKFADQMVILFGGDPSQVRSMIMEEEFRQLVDLGYKEGVLEEGESELIHRIFELGNKTVNEIMRPSGEIFRVSLNQPFEKIIADIRATQFSRIPVYHKDPDNIVGVLHSRDLFRLYRNRQKGKVQKIEDIVRPVHFVKDDIIIEDLLTEFQKLKMHLAIVLNKREKPVGLVTMDDIFRLLFTQKLEWKRKIKSQMETPILSG